MHPLTSSLTGLSSLAPLVSTDLTAKPSIAEFEKLGTSSVLITSLARTPWACSEAILKSGNGCNALLRILIASLYVIMVHLLHIYIR